MSKKATAKAPPEITIAELGSQGRVIRGQTVTEEEAVAQRKSGKSVVVCGKIGEENRKLGQRIENTVGPNVMQPPHASAGRYALPHFQPQKRPQQGHTFYETERRKAAKNA